MTDLLATRPIVERSHYIHLGAPDFYLLKSVASLAKWGAVVLVVLACAKLLMSVFLFRSIGAFSEGLSSSLFGGSNPEGSMLDWYFVLMYNYKAILLILPLILLYRFGTAVSSELLSGREVMVFSKSFTRLRVLLLVILAEGLLSTGIGYFMLA